MENNHLKKKETAFLKQQLGNIAKRSGDGCRRYREIKGFTHSLLNKIMDKQRLKEKIKACELKISDMKQQILILRMKIEREKQILMKYQESLKNQNYAIIKERF